MNKIIKVDRVQSVSEAIQLEKVGANIIGVSLSKNARFNDNRNITLNTAFSIGQSLTNAKYAIEVDFNWELKRIVKLAKELRVDFIQPNDHNIPDAKYIRALAAEGIQIIYPHIEVSHNSDPSWILSRFEGKKQLNAAYFQLDIFSDYSDDAWQFIKYESPEYPEEIQIDDINRLAEQWSLLLCFNYTEGNIIEILDTFSSAKGVSFVLADSVKWSFHYFDYLTCEKIIRQLQKIRR